MRALAKWARTHCKAGHLFTEASVYWVWDVANQNYRRRCAECQVARNKAYQKTPRGREMLERKKMEHRLKYRNDAKFRAEINEQVMAWHRANPGKVKAGHARWLQSPSGKLYLRRRNAGLPSGASLPLIQAAETLKLLRKEMYERDRT